jgi:NAD(P)-dependent dehydrogenase (short-subunit alcohol dehydrogenase family)
MARHRSRRVISDAVSLTGMMCLKGAAARPWNVDSRPHSFLPGNDIDQVCKSVCQTGSANLVSGDIALNYLAAEKVDVQKVQKFASDAASRWPAFPVTLATRRFFAICSPKMADEFGGIDIMANVAGKQTSVDAIAHLTTEQFEATFRIKHRTVESQSTRGLCFALLTDSEPLRQVREVSGNTSRSLR